MNIRRFKNGDENALYHVFFSAVHDTASMDYAPEQLEAWAPAVIDLDLWASRMRERQPIVVERANEIVGYADIQSNGFIDDLFLSGIFARQGIGSLLMNRILEEAKRLGIAEITSNVSKTAESFFLRHGFYVVERAFPIRRGV